MLRTWKDVVRNGAATHDAIRSSRRTEKTWYTVEAWKTSCTVVQGGAGHHAPKGALGTGNLGVVRRQPMVNYVSDLGDNVKHLISCKQQLIEQPPDSVCVHIVYARFALTICATVNELGGIQ